MVLIVESLPYLVKRTANGNLPVYTEYKNSRSRAITIIRRIDGDIESLRNDLERKVFGSANLEAEGSHHGVQVDVAIRKPSNHIWINGNVSRNVRYWLTSIGF